MRLSGHSGLEVELNANGSLRRFDCGAVSLSLFVGNEIEGGPANLYLRCHADRIEWTPLLGPSQPDALSRRCAQRGAADGPRFVARDRAIRSRSCSRKSAPAWFWHVRLENTSAEAQHVDLTYAQDLALASVRRRAPERVLREPVHRSHAAVACDAWGDGRLAAESGGDGRNPWSPDRLVAQGRIVRHGCVAVSRARDACRTSRRWASRRPAEQAPAARALDGRHS